MTLTALHPSRHKYIPQETKLTKLVCLSNLLTCASYNIIWGMWLKLYFGPLDIQCSFFLYSFNYIPQLTLYDARVKSVKHTKLVSLVTGWIFLSSILDEQVFLMMSFSRQ